ncbi:MAG: hypothetical protein FJZ00_13205 [Candidatus Sericytochromatia bacterium]|uniref:Uncharacterized protein n=1 Tax=Candidatus Tanganyikabacteria bacterium TaxID=2961651 RepID=A0A937X8I3_9BACT|nr:hypothetical protein [Candidatus Tanganyikabacteria bacterium]
MSGLAARGTVVPVDTVMVTPDEVEQHENVHHMVIKPALTYGKVIYAS